MVERLGQHTLLDRSRYRRSCHGIAGNDIFVGPLLCRPQGCAIQSLNQEKMERIRCDAVKLLMLYYY